MFPVLASLIPRRLSWLDYVALGLYFAINLGIGWWCYRRKRASSADFFLGGGRINWWAAAISFFATGTSSISFMALPAKTFSEDWKAFGSVPAQVFSGVLVGFVFVSLLRRLYLVSVFGYLEQRFDHRVRLLGAGLAILLKVCGRMAVVMLLPSLALSTVTGLNVYTSIFLMGSVTTLYAMEGGFEAVVWTDVLQVAVMLGGAGLALAEATSGVSGGLAGIVTSAHANEKFQLVSWSFNIYEPTAWVFLGMFFATIFTQVGDQPQMQRMLATADNAAAKRTVVIGNAIGLFTGALFFFIGTALWAFYRAHPDRLDPALSNDAIFPYFIANELPTGVVGLIVAGLFAAAMGALSSAMNAAAAIVVSDFLGTSATVVTEASRVRVARCATFVCGLLATGMAIFLAWRNVTSLWDEFLKLIALIGGGFPGVFALGLLSRRANAPGVIVGAIASIAVTWWAQHFTRTNVFLHSFVAIASCMVIGYLASLGFGGAARNKALAGLTVWDRAPNLSS